MLAVDSENTVYKWQFNSSNDVAHAVRRAFHDHQHTYYQEVVNRQEWAPDVLSGNSPEKAQDSFMYRDQNGIRSILLDDDNCNCFSSLSFGRGMCYDDGRDYSTILTEPEVNNCFSIFNSISFPILKLMFYTLLFGKLFLFFFFFLFFFSIFSLELLTKPVLNQCCSSTCDQIPCRNGGTCIPVYENNSYACQCPPIAEGKHCEEVQWTAFWWYDANTAWPDWEEDVLKYDFGHCNSTDPTVLDAFPGQRWKIPPRCLLLTRKTPFTNGNSTPAMMLLMQSGAHSMITSTHIIRKW
ncbi:unnamed protein product [Porites evermanni]|uniref:EGF-like domain-containing protein n=1 Tax=Porites evermanni TaxID=104178 RepID=A0ABN8LQB0_9CNID|nr:unnamed protein product [Porites evermanni]